MTSFIQQTEKIFSKVSKTKQQQHFKLDPNSSNELFQQWEKSQSEFTDMDQYAELGIKIVSLQQSANRNINSSFKSLNNFMSKYQFGPQIYSQYLKLAKSTHLNNFEFLNEIYESVILQEDINLSLLIDCADLQCENAELISKLIDKVHDRITDTELQDYLYALAVLIPNEQSTMLLNLVIDKLRLMKTAPKTPQLHSSCLILDHLFRFKNQEVPKIITSILYEKFVHETQIIKQSQLQESVQILLNMVKIEYKQEYMIHNFQIDFYLLQRSQVLEVNGPQHYIYDIEKGNPKILNGKHYFKQMVLSALGYDLRNLAYLEFYQSRGVTRKLELLRSIID